MRALAVSLLMLALPAQAALSITRVTPAGNDVEPGSQIVIAFDKAVVPLGRMERKPEEVPVTITPAVACQWRWLDPQDLACQLPEDGRLRDATRYTVEVRPEFVTEFGEKLEKGLTHSFVSQRPALRWGSVSGWDGPTTPVMRLYFNQPVAKSAVAASITLAESEVDVLPDLHDRETPYYVPGAGGGAGEEARSTWLVKPKAPLTADIDGQVRVAPGLVSAFGTEAGIERRGALKFRTFPTPRFLGLRCRLPEGGEQIILRPDATVSTLCDPLAGAALLFSAPVAAAEIKRAVKITPDPSGGRADYDPWANASDNVGLASTNIGRDWSVALPFTLKADAAYQLQAGTPVKDVFGREVDLHGFGFRTAHRSPALSFDHETSVLEQGVDSEVPVVVTNLGKLLTQYTRYTASGVETGQSAAIPVAPAQDIAFAMPLGVRGLLGGKSGVVDGWLDTEPRLRENGSAPKGHAVERYFAEITPWQLHVKLGHYDTLVWVTEFATGKPVVDAEVSAFATVKGGWSAEGEAKPASARTGPDGMAVLPGTETLDPDGKHRGWNSASPLAVRVVKGADIALLPLSNDFNVDVYRASRYQVSTDERRKDGHLKSWGTTAQGVYRAGDAVQYKVYVRKDGARGLVPAPEGPYQLKVFDPAEQVVHQRDDVKLSAFGAFDGSFTVAKQGKVGWYRFELKPAFSTDKKSTKKTSDDEDATNALQPLRVLISDFTPAPFKLAAEIHAPRATPGTPVTAEMSATLHAGGPFGNAPATLAARIVAQAFESPDPVAAKFRFDGRVDEDGDNARDSRGLAEKPLRTDGQGQASAEFTPPESDIAWGKLVVEASAQDDRGRSVAATASVPYAGRARLIGLRSQDWLLQEDKTTQVETLVVDAEGKPVAGTPYYVKVERREVTMARVKDAGNVYVARYSEKWVGVQVCKGRSKLVPLACRFKPDTGGAYRITAMTRDTANRLHTSALWQWASGSKTFLWQEPDDYGLELVPERKGPFKLGDTARFLVKNPYPGATALVTTERFGVIERHTETLQGSAPVIEVPITAAHVPGFYLSVVVQSPRVASPPPDGDVDLGKPAFRMGYATVNVEDPVKRIEVAVKPERAQYKPRETAKVELVATPKSAMPAGERIELAVAVLDEAVYDLIKDGEGYFDPYKGFYGLEPLDLANYSLLTRLVGRQKFEKKGATPGGDGGLDLSLRSVDKYVAYWNPALAVDAAGHAQFEFKLPDNLTAWKVLVLATSPSDRMGLGSGKLTASKLTELRPALPNQVSTGDSFRAGFSVLNRGDAPRTLKVKLAAKQAGEGGAPYEKTSESEVTLKGFERKTVFFDIVPDHAGTLDFTATAADAQDSDGLKVSLPVRPRKPTMTAADYGFLDEGALTQNVLVPADSLPGGDIAVRFTPTVLGNLDGAFKYIRDYPYGCWEQRLTKAVMAAHYGRLKPYLDPQLKWDEAAELVGRLYDDAAGFQAPSGGMTYWNGDEAHVSPYLSAYTALAFEWLRAEGRPPPKAVTDKLDGYLDGLLRKDVPDYSLEASSNVRAVVLAALAARGKLKAADLQRYAPALPRMGLFGQALFAQAAIKTQGAETLAMDALNQVMARGQESAGSYVLRETDEGFWSWLLGSELRSNCAALSALVALPGKNLDSNPGLAELPMKLVRTITQARAGKVGGAHADHWENTQENVFCLAALDDYARRYESVTPAFSMSALLGGAPLGTAKFKALRDAPVAFSHPIAAADIGKSQPLAITHEGQGRGYFVARVSYVQKDEAAQADNAGLQLKRSYAVKRDGQWVDLTSPLKIRRGELLRVTLTLNAPSKRYFVVVDDPVPGGLEPLNPDLATASGLAAEDMAAAGSGYPYPFYHRELRFEAARFFSDEVEQGTHTLSWIGQAVAVGTFAVPAPHTEQMYDPDVFGNDVPAQLIVEEAPEVSTAPAAAAK